MKKLIPIYLLAFLAPALVWAQVSFTLTSSSFYMIKSKPKVSNKTTLTIEITPKSKGKWVSTGGSVQYISKPNATIQIKEPLVLNAEQNLPAVANPEKVKINSLSTADNLHLKVDLTTPTFSIAVYDLIGKPLFKGNYKNLKDKNIFIPTDQFASGLYFVKVEWEGKTEVKSFTKL